MPRKEAVVVATILHLLNPNRRTGRLRPQCRITPSRSRNRHAFATAGATTWYPEPSCAINFTSNRRTQSGVGIIGVGVSYLPAPAGRGYGHKTVCHAWGEYACDKNGDGLCKVHVNTTEGLWWLLRFWSRPHRGISQDKLPLYFNFLQFVHNARRRGKALLGAIVAGLVA